MKLPMPEKSWRKDTLICEIYGERRRGDSEVFSKITKLLWAAVAEERVRIPTFLAHPDFSLNTQGDVGTH